MTTETEAIAKMAWKPDVQKYGADDEDPDVYVLSLPPGWTSERFDVQELRAAPRRSKGSQRVLDAESFVAEVQRRALTSGASGTTVYADARTLSLVAVLNDDNGTAPGWRDYRVEYEVALTPEWVHWGGRNNTDLALESFARHIEDGLEQIVEPPAADMLELAQTFHAQTGAKFKQASRLATGSTSLVYEEDVSASAGAAGQVEIPQTFTLRLAPLYGTPVSDVEAWFRYRLKSGQLTLSYKLRRPEEFERSGFAYVVDRVSELGIKGIVSGPPPQARTS